MKMALRKPNIEKMKVEKDVKGLVRAWRTSLDRDVRMKAEWALGEIGEPAVEPMIKALKDDWEEPRGSVNDRGL
jgi:HEAT repeat protein